MTAVGTTSNARGDLMFSGRTMPRSAPLIVIVGGLVLAGLLTAVGLGPVASIILGVIAVDIALPVWTAVVVNRRAATDRLVTCLVWTALLCAMAPLVWLLVTTLVSGIPAITVHFLTHDMQTKLNPVTFKMESGGGVLHALIGTLLVTFGAIVISVPLGLMCAIYLVEYGRGKQLPRMVTLLVDVMTGIPSIVAGLFALALFAQFGGIGTRMGVMGSVALSLLMIPTVVRSTEEMIRLVPDDLREAAYALGVSRWRTIVKVVLPTSIGGIVTGVMLAISRVIGETAPLLVAIGSIDVIQTNLFSGRIQTLPVFIMTEYETSTPQGYAFAWGGALLLIAIVMVLNIIARIIGSIFAPKISG
ncbi:phosphate transport system permease protein PstA [Microlunatus endophyticus]|uniref:Phosphate transport system permease protein PstA n=1 Tax=Microlunatus endophyticus TaxID=1716077 RepID=A0A917S4U8_9ACTN|nr:phosphate ABC transporter permease PstA [Microlunatus endophyticus]GGL58197.1 phosphate transport system permease protein PstA [Microlunatus endophyticus]